MEVPSMVQRSGNRLIVRSVVSGNQLFVDSGSGSLLKTSSTTPTTGGSPHTDSLNLEAYRSRAAAAPVIDFDNGPIDEIEAQNDSKDEGLPQCKIKRNYSCNSCTFFTQNPRHFLTHLRDCHGEKIVINECKLCLYASRHYQKLVRHMKMVHGSTEGIEEHSQARKRQMGRELRKRKLEVENHQVPIPVSPQIINPIEKYEEPPLQEEGPQNRLLKCSVCDFTTLYRVQLVEHEQEEHYKTKFFRCEKCSYVTHIKTRFSKHVKYHSMPMIKCVTCDFRTPYKWNLDRHMKNHGGSGPYKCAACNFTADIKQSLTVHEMNHHVPPVGHAAGISMARRKNKVGATDIPDELLSENGDISDSYNNNNNNVDAYEEPYDKKFKLEDDDQPTDLSQKGCDSKKSVARPIPNLIPIQAANNALNLTKTFYDLNKMLQRGLNLSNRPNNSSDRLQSLFVENGEITVEKVDGPQLSPSSTGSSAASKKKGNFFDQLKQNATLLNKNGSLVCDCGHTSKCLSESIIHQKSCSRDDLDKISSPSPINLSVNSGSTRCQFCRHRCKSSVDLIAHMKSCPDAASGVRHESFDSSSDSHEKNDDASERTSPQEKHPMENRVFVWNNLPNRMDADNAEEIDDEKPIDGSNKSTDYMSEDQKKDNSENSYYGVETAPGYGEVTKKMSPEEEAANSSLKKVYKCPHCSFWASTASRFHVHIVGHLNKKPFECSLCNYRSNWRWDITKHIRLKTIRDPNHKNAKVLMNDETGRRNYTKYNKYITLMKVTEEDGDPKLLKSGEMTPNQEASLSFLNDYKRENDFGGAGAGSNEPGPSKNLSPIDASRMMQMAFFPNSLLNLAGQPDQMKRSPPPLMKPSEDIVTQNIDVKPDGSDKRTLYKCRKCNYRNSNRDMVLSHVKIHYQEASLNMAANALSSLPEHLQAAVNSNPYMKNVIAAMCLSQQQHLAMGENPSMLASLPSSSVSSQINHHGPSSHPSLNLGTNQSSQQLPLAVGNVGSKLSSTTNPIQLPVPSVNPIGSPSNILSVAAAGGSKMGTTKQTTTAAIINNNNNNNNSNNNNNNTTNPTNSIEHGEADEASSGVVTTTGTGVTGWRGPAPYRCGHCHQVSNWKHVIQRHCRLKHNGDIRIETIDRNSDKNMPVYYPLTSQPSQSFNNSNHSTAAAAASAAPYSSNCNAASANGSSQPPFIFSQDQSSSKLFGAPFMQLPQQPVAAGEAYRDSIDVDGSSSVTTVAGRPRQQQCPLCPFVSESKSQMMYHNSLHKCKSDFYQCGMCDYTCSKKQLLSQHLKISHDDKMDQGHHVAGDTPEQNEIIGQAISFCPRCPARYIGSKDLNLHLKMHTTNYSYRCGLCSYTALQEASLLSHSTVHTQSYEEKTVKLLHRFTEDVHYPRPKLATITLNSGDRVWIVERNHEPDPDDSKIGVKLVESSSVADRKPPPSLLKQQLESTTGATSNSATVDYLDDYALKRCPHCPFETKRSSVEMKLHLEHHISVSNKKHSATCMHCDFSVADERALKDHVSLHFKSITNNDVPFYTSYENLELNLVEGSDNRKKGSNDLVRERSESVSEGSSRKETLLFKSDTALMNGLVPKEEQQRKADESSKDDGDSGEEKQIVVATSGELLKVRSSSP